jgi:hypothetical protein
MDLLANLDTQMLRTKRTNMPIPKLLTKLFLQHTDKAGREVWYCWELSG